MFQVCEINHSSGEKVGLQTKHVHFMVALEEKSGERQNLWDSSPGNMLSAAERRVKNMTHGTGLY